MVVDPFLFATDSAVGKCNRKVTDRIPYNTQCPVEVSLSNTLNPSFTLNSLLIFISRELQYMRK